MSRYIARPMLVDAFVIQGIGEDPAGTLLRLDSGDLVVAAPEMTARITPVVGDYLVRQEDGYTYLNPKLVFERKYAKYPAG